MGSERELACGVGERQKTSGHQHTAARPAQPLFPIQLWVTLASMGATTYQMWASQLPVRLYCVTPI